MSAHAPHDRCAVHDLACGPDGRCVLCRRSSAPPAPAAWSRLWVGALAILSLVVAGTIAWRGARGFLAAARSPATSAPAQADGQAEVRLFVTAWCPHCKRAERWLDEHKVEYTAIDVEKDRSASLEHRKLSPRGTIPTLSVGREVVVGFDASAFERAIARGRR